MVARRALTAVLTAQLIAFAVSAQQSSEFGRASGGQLVLTPKGAAPVSGSLQLSLSSGSDVFGRGSSPGYGLTAGGTLIEDRLWFFGSASQQVSQTRFADLELPANATTSAIGARAGGRIGAGHDFSAFFEAARRPELSTTSRSSLDLVPSSFLSLRYTGVISSNMFFNASVTRDRAE
jgi:hypothetical protein